MRSLAHLAFLIGFSSGDWQGFLWVCLGVCIQVAFYGMLRPGELFGLTFAHIRFPAAWVGESPFAVLAILAAKNSHALGFWQFATVRSVAATAWLRWLGQGRKHDARLWPASQAVF